MSCFYYQDYSPRYLPSLGLDVHATVLSASSRTVITQTYENQSSTEAIGEVFYAFPLYEGSGVTGFICRVGDKAVKGIVKPRKGADEIYQEAKALGKTAAVFDQSERASDVFKTRIGNLPAGENVYIELTLVAELKQDAQTNGPRYTLPLTIIQRYGTRNDNLEGPFSPGFDLSLTWIKVDVMMEKGSDIRNIRSPTHPIDVTLGRTSTMPGSTFEPCYASINLRENTAMREGFVLTVNATNQDLPCAFLETHPTLPNQRALMVSLVPKFEIPTDASEIIFVIDRSGSMQDKLHTLRSALEIFLKSLPMGIHFNIVSFGSHHTFLWPRSRACNRKNLEQALKLTKKIQADYYGTEILEALKAAVEKRYRDKVPEILLLTDGQIWNQAETFEFVKKSNNECSARFFTLGMGNSVSHSLIEGISRAGSGFSQSVLMHEELSKKVIRMLKGALMGRLHNTILDMDLPETKREEFVEIEAPKISDDKAAVKPAAQPIPLFDENHKESELVGEVHQPLPKVSVPSIMQVPTAVPHLFPFIRSTVYVLSQDIASFPKKITLRTNSSIGPLELEVPVQDVGLGETIHQLAAKKEMGELEEGRGWIRTAKDSQGDLITANFESRAEELAEAECERLGVRFQVAGKHCSFVAIHENQCEDSEDEILVGPEEPNKGEFPINT